MLKYRMQSLHALVRLEEDSNLDPLTSHLGEGYDSGAGVAQICRVAITTRFWFK